MGIAIGIYRGIAIGIAGNGGCPTTQEPWE
jgi:hypothetical protein